MVTKINLVSLVFARMQRLRLNKLGLNEGDGDGDGTVTNEDAGHFVDLAVTNEPCACLSDPQPASSLAKPGELGWIRRSILPHWHWSREAPDSA